MAAKVVEYGVDCGRVSASGVLTKNAMGYLLWRRLRTRRVWSGADRIAAVALRKVTTKTPDKASLGQLFIRRSPIPAFSAIFLREISMHAAKRLRRAVFHATNRGSNAGDHVAKNVARPVNRVHYRGNLLVNRELGPTANPKNLPGEHCVQHATVQIRTDAAATPYREIQPPWRSVTNRQDAAPALYFAAIDDVKTRMQAERQVLPQAHHHSQMSRSQLPCGRSPDPIPATDPRAMALGMMFFKD
jgi:hypothetical protein